MTDKASVVEALKAFCARNYAHYGCNGCVGDTPEAKALQAAIPHAEATERVVEVAKRGSFGSEVGAEGEERFWLVFEGQDAIDLNSALNSLEEGGAE